MKREKHRMGLNEIELSRFVQFRKYLCMVVVISQVCGRSPAEEDFLVLDLKMS
jgi:hypothetical protein